MRLPAAEQAREHRLLAQIKDEIGAVAFNEVWSNRRRWIQDDPAPTIGDTFDSFGAYMPSIDGHEGRGILNGL